MSSTDVYGPALPPGFKKEEIASKEVKESTVEEENSVDLIGPQCPSHLLKSNNLQNDFDELGSPDEEEEEEEFFPINHDAGIVGPALPPDFSQLDRKDDESDSDSSQIYGPLPPSHHSTENIDSVLADIEKRSSKMKDKLKESANPSIKRAEREEWMTSPATGYKNQFGDISRCLVGESSGSKSRRCDSSQGQKQEKVYSRSEKKLKKQLEEYDEIKRPESLLEMHRKERRRKAKEDSKKPKKRQPFDRDTELGMRFFNKEQVNSVIKKAKFVNSRFQAGASHYL